MNEYILGNVFGLSQVIIGYPFDTLKTNLQNKQSIKPFITKPLLLYRGVKFPLFMNCIGVSFMFGNYDYFLKMTDSRLLSGMATGFISGFLITPFDYRKIQMQMIHNNLNILNNLNSLNNSNNSNNNKLFYNYKKYFNGLIFTLSREIISVPTYFITFNYLNNELKYNSFISGGIAGVSSWFISYPLDTLKTRKQLFNTLNIYQLIKIGPLYNGLTITLVRAFIVNSVCFTIYDKLKNLIINN